MADSPRARRLAERIQQIVATTLDRRVKDPRLGFVTITDVRVTGDLQHATVYYTVFGSEEELAGTAAALSSATGLLRREVGRDLGLRLVPTLEFTTDQVPETARQLDTLLAEAQRRDAEIAQSSVGAQHAGDADPYRSEDQDSEDSEDEDTEQP
jgi:ribosome-binding factor A